MANKAAEATMKGIYNKSTPVNTANTVNTHR